MERIEPSSNELDTLVVGAGISGLSLGYCLSVGAKHHQPLRVLVAESQGRVGGNITTATADGFLWEEGPNSFLPAPDLLQLVVDLGLKSQLVLADRKLPRYVYWQGELMAVPMSPPALFSSKLVSDRGKARALLGALGFVPPAIGPHLQEQGGEETVAQFFTRHLGPEVVERLVQPFVSGVYAGDASQLSASAAFNRVTRMAEVGGGLVAGALLGRQPKPPVNPDLPSVKPGELGSFRSGLKTLPEALASQLGERVRLNWHLTHLHPTERHTYLAEFATDSGPQTVEARTVVFTTPIYAVGEALQHLGIEPINQTCPEFIYPPVASVVLAYPKSCLKVDMKGFGNLIPRHQGIRTLGTIWTSSLFPGRAPEGWQMLTNYIGGATDPGIGELTPEEIVKQVHQDLRQTLLKEDKPPKVLAVHLWKRAIPQYTLGHHQRLQQLETGLQSMPGIYLCSNYIDGVALGDCVRRAVNKAAEVRQELGCRV